MVFPELAQSTKNKEAAVAEISVQPSRAQREFDGQRYILTKIDYTKEAAEEDQAYYRERGRDAKVLEEDGFWLLYTRIGQ